MKVELESGAWMRGEPSVDGEGDFGAVYKVQTVDGSSAVARFAPRAPGMGHELLIGDSLRAAELRNIVPAINQDEHKDFWVLVMPRADKLLVQHLGESHAPLGLSEVVSILDDIVTAPSDINGAVTRRGLKLQNVLLLDGTRYVVDSGIARYARATTTDDTRKFGLTSPYGAPEQQRSGRATSATDIYAFGVIVFQLLLSTLPFGGPDPVSYREQHPTANPPPLTTRITRLRILIEECLYKTPQTQPNATNVLVRLATATERPPCPGLPQLTQMGHTEVQYRTQSHAHEVKQREKFEHRAQIFVVVEQSFGSFSQPLLQVIEDNASTATIEVGADREKMRFMVELSGAELNISRSQPSPTWQDLFDVITFANIEVNLENRSRMGWGGRSRSL